MMRVILYGVGVLALAAPMSPAVAGSYSAGAANAAQCVADTVAALRPGLGLQGSSGSFELSGPVTCKGTIGGGKPTGPGVYSSAGRAGTEKPASCSGGTGWAVGRLEIDTDKGKRVVVSPLTFSWGAVTKDGLLTGDSEGDYISGPFTVTPTKGDCVTSPLRKAKAKLTFTVHGFRNGG